MAAGTETLRRERGFRQAVTRGAGIALFVAAGGCLPALAGSPPLITTVAGNGSAIYDGDDVPGPEASLAAPNGVALDAAGNLYIADRDHHRVRRLDAATGLISTVAGTGVAGYTGDGVPAP